MPGLKLVSTPQVVSTTSRKLSKGEEASYKAKIKPTEEGFYTIYTNLYDDHGVYNVSYFIDLPLGSFIFQSNSSFFAIINFRKVCSFSNGIKD